MVKSASLWLETSPSANYPTLQKDVLSDVAIIGGGLTGLTTAYLLKQAGLQVVVIDKAAVGSGTSGKTTGKISSQHGLIYEKLVSQHGPEAAKIYGEANQSAINQIQNIIKKEKIDCDWQRDDSYVFTTDLTQIPKFKKEAEAAKSCGLPASFETASPLPFPIAGAVRFTGQAKFHARNYLLGLARAVNSDGSCVYENTRAIGIRDGQPCRIRTPKGKITAQHVVVATNVPTLPLVARGAYCMVEYPQTSYVVAAKTNRPISGMYISPDQNNYSILPVAAAGQQFLLIGGASHLRGPRIKNRRFAQLENYAKDKFAISRIDYKWSAWDYLSYDDIPLVGRVYPWSKYLYGATAFMKWGLTNTTVAGMILADIIQSRPNPWAHTFDSLRSDPIKSLPRVMKEKVTGA
jgi:glycine/D-amino acid oxidase-like deaminating enzyme